MKTRQGERERERETAESRQGEQCSRHRGLDGARTDLRYRDVPVIEDGTEHKIRKADMTRDLR